MSRPSSRRGKAGKKKGAKTPKKQIAELTEQNTQLTEQLDSTRLQYQQLQSKMDIVTDKLVNSINKKDFCISDKTDLTQLTADVLTEMIEKLVVKKKIQEMSVEARTEELELRVTEMSMDIAKNTKKCLAYESGFQQLLNCSSIDEVKDRVYELQVIAGEEFHGFTYNDPARTKEVFINGVDKPDGATKRMLENAEKLNLVPPTKKYPGETPVSAMHRDLKLYLIKELSLERESGADWRMFASRVGIDEDIIAEWQSLRLDFSMGRVLSEWAKSENATVRMLHRHLMSPQLRRTILAKRVSDFYEVN